MDGLSDRAQSETFDIDLTKRHPETFCRIVGCMNLVSLHMADIEHIEGMNIHARVTIDVRNGEKILHLADFQTRLFLDFADDALLACLVVVNEAAWQVKGALGGFLATTHNEQLTPTVQNEGCRGRTGILVVGEPAVRTVLAFEVVDLEILTATLRAILEQL